MKQKIIRQKKRETARKKARQKKKETVKKKKSE